jgi:hypothetical protein
MSLVFISYARADASQSNRLHKDLTAAGYDVWLDTERLVVGQQWKPEIRNAIRRSSAFIALLSNHSVSHRGYVQHELKEALDVLRTVPANQVYLMPARIEEVRPTEQELEDLTWVDLFPEYAAGLEKLVRALKTVIDLNSTTSTASTSSLVPAAVALPFSSMGDVFRTILHQMPTESVRLDGRNGLYILFMTNHEGVIVPRHLKENYPKDMAIILQHQYAELVVGEKEFSVKLSFSGSLERLTVPYSAISMMREEHTKLVLRN